MTPAATPNRGWLVPGVVLLLGAVMGSSLMWTLNGRQASPPAVPVAIVNLDHPVTTGSGKDEKTVAAGRQLAAGLTQPTADQQTPLSWQIVDTDDAASGLRDGDYYAVLTIPADFSAAVTSTSGTGPVAARLRLVTNDASSTAVAALARLAVTQAAATLGDQVTHGFVDSTLSSITSISTNLGDTASSAAKLASSSKDLAASITDLADGSRSLADGADDLADGASQAAIAADRLAGGSEALDHAAGQLAAGANRTAAGARTTAGGASRTSRGASAVAAQTRIQSTGLGRLGRASSRTARASDRVADQARQLAASCPTGTEPGYCAQVGRLALASRVESRAVAAVGRGVDVAGRRADRIANASGTVARGSHGVASGAAEVSSGTAQVSRGAVGLDRAAGSLATGAGQLATATLSLASGTKANAAGAATLASSADQLDDGAGQLATGAGSLASGLKSFARSVPRYTEDERSTLDAVVTTPVAVDASAEHAATVEASLTPVVLTATLWLAGLMVFLACEALPTGLAWAQTGLVRRVFSRWLPAVGIGVSLTLVLLVVVALAGVQVRSPAGLALFCGLGVLASSATNQALVALLGPVGRVVAVVLAVVQAAAVGGLVPIETAPGLFRTLNAVLPVPQLVDGAGQLVLGGSSGGLGAAVAVLLGWTVLGLLATLVAASRQLPVPGLLTVRSRLRRLTSAGPEVELT